MAIGVEHVVLGEIDTSYGNFCRIFKGNEWVWLAEVDRQSYIPPEPNQIPPDLNEVPREAVFNLIGKRVVFEVTPQDDSLRIKVNRRPFYLDNQILYYNLDCLVDLQGNFDIISGCEDLDLIEFYKDDIEMVLRELFPTAYSDYGVYEEAQEDFELAGTD